MSRQIAFLKSISILIDHSISNIFPLSLAIIILIKKIMMIMLQILRLNSAVILLVVD